MLRLYSAAILGLGMMVLSTLAQDSTVKTEWNKYLPINVVMAEVRKVDGDSIVLRVYYMAPNKDDDDKNDKDKNKNNNNNNNNKNKNNNNKNNKNGNKNNNNQSQLQRMIQQARNSNNNPPAMHQEHHDYDVKYFPDTSVTGKIPAPSDDAGASKTLTPKNLTPGMVVQAALIRDKSIAPQDFTPKDIKVRAINVVGTNPNYKADPAPAAKKKN